MSQDIISDSLNQIMNASRANKTKVELKRKSKLLISLLAIAKLKGYIKNYEIQERVVKVDIGNLNKCNTIKPRFTVQVDEIEKYVKRYLPAKNLGIIIVSTSKGIMTHSTAMEKNMGGCLLAYFY